MHNAQKDSLLPPPSSILNEYIEVFRTQNVRLRRLTGRLLEMKDRLVAEPNPIAADTPIPSPVGSISALQEQLARMEEALSEGEALITSLERVV